MSKTEKKTKTKKLKTNPKGTRVSKSFAFDLSDAEVREKVRCAGELRKEFDALHTKFEENKETTKAKLTALAGRRDDAYRVAEAGIENRTVDAILVKNYDEKKIEYWFEGKMIEHRAMTENELQIEANFDKKGVVTKARAIKQTLQKNDGKDPIAAAHANGKLADIAEVHQMETSRKGKTSAVDGPTRQ